MKYIKSWKKKLCNFHAEIFFLNLQKKVRIATNIQTTELKNEKLLW